MNCNSVKELVDVELYASLLNLFGERNYSPKWLLDVQGLETDNTLTVEKFQEIVKTTDDFRKLHAIALFLWFTQLDSSDFVLRALRIVENQFDSILECFLFNSCRLMDDRDLFKYMLLHGEPKSVLEICITLYAVKGNITEFVCQDFLSKAVYMLHSKPLDVVDDVSVFWGLSTFRKIAGNLCPDFIVALEKMRRTVISAKASLIGACQYCGLALHDVKTLTYLLQKTNHDYQMSYEKRKSLVETIFVNLGLSSTAWSDSKKKLAKEVFINTNVLTVSNVENLKWCIKNGWSKHLSTRISNFGIPELLVREYRDDVIYVLSNSLQNTNLEELIHCVKKFPAIIELLFSQYKEEFFGYYQAFFDSDEFDEEELKKYRSYYAKYLSDFTDVRAIELLKSVRENRNSLEYQLLMSKSVTYSEVLSKKDNNFLKREVEKYVYLYLPEEYENFVGGVTNE